MKQRILIATLIIGLATLSAGAATSALFNDTETSEGNTFQAGELDLKIDWEEHYNGELVETQELTNNPGPIFNLDDIKPGDHGEATVSLHLKNNPGWIWMNLTQTANQDNACTEPERQAEGGNCGTQGELGEHLEFTIWRDDGDNELDDDEEVMFEGTAHELSEASVSEGLLLDSDPSTEEVDAFPGSETSYIGIKWHVPLETGNEIQGDSKTFDFTFYTEQERHNPQNGQEPPEEPEDQPPVASFERANNEPMVADVNESVRLFSTSTDDDGITKKKWNLGDGTIRFGQDVWHNWTSPGNYTVTLTVTDTAGQTDSASQTMVIREPEDDEPNETDADFTVSQGDETNGIEPISGNMTVEELYDLRFPPRFNHSNQTLNGATYPDSGLYYQSVGTSDLQQQETSIMFLYDGPDGLSLVVVHDMPGGDGGSTTWTIHNLPSDGEWVVKDDLYLTSDGQKASSNYDDWQVDTEPQVINWTWGGGGTDGGAFMPLGDDFNVTIDAAFNEESPIYEQHYNGDIDDWQMLSGDRSNPQRISLSLDEPVTIQSE